jgi:V-type H+-transporting ATPase subunit H
MSLDPPSYVVSIENNIRSRPIPWEGAVRQKTISDIDHQQIKAIDKVRKEQRKEVLDSDVATYVALFLGGKDGPGILHKAVKRPDMIVYLLVLLDDAIEGMPNNQPQLAMEQSLMIL